MICVAVGRIQDESVEDAAITLANTISPLPATWMGRVKIEKIPWLSCPSTIAEFDCLNISALAAFIREAASLEGIRAENRIGQTRWPHLPDYEQTYWLPLNFDTPRVFNDASGFPFAIASASQLLQNLEAIRSMSSYDLGIQPVGFGSKIQTELTPATTLQWVWWSLHAAATSALSHNAPLALG